jgi:hypothetical protein
LSIRAVGPRKVIKVPAQASEIDAPATSFAAPVQRAVLQQPSAAEQIPRPYSRAEENARELNGDFGMTEPLRVRLHT